ncbi:hypothetical protein ACMD2_22871, partial [Ananas comosus]
ICNT